MWYYCRLPEQYTMTQPTLWEKIEGYHIGPEKTPIGFSTQLSKEARVNMMTAGVIEYEYKKFMYLCAVQDQPVSPSSLIDKAWHLHLTYSKDYWEDFCENILGKKIHHQPSDGTATDQDQMKANFEFTQTLYKEEFNEPMPENIWFADQLKAKKANRNRKVFRYASLLTIFIIGSFLIPFVSNTALIFSFLVLGSIIWVGTSASNQQFFADSDFKFKSDSFNGDNLDNDMTDHDSSCSSCSSCSSD